MLDLRKDKNDIGRDVKVFTDHIPTTTERGITNVKQFVSSYYFYLLLVLVLVALAKYPAPIGSFFGEWWHTFSAAFLARQANI